MYSTAIADTRYRAFPGSVGMGIPIGFSMGMGWVWGLKSNPHGSPVRLPGKK